MSILRHYIPYPDAVRVEQLVVNATADVVYDATLTTDFLGAVRNNRSVAALFATRSLAERLVAKLRRREFREPPAPASLRLVDLPTHGEWIRLASDPPREFAFGVIGRFWAGETKWILSDAATFAMHAEPHVAKIGCYFATYRLANGRTLLRYEVRTDTADGDARRAFLRYWRVVSPFVGYIMRATLREIARNAERRAATAPAGDTRMPALAR